MAADNQLAAKLGGVRVGLRRDLHVTRQRMRGEPHYVLHDPVAFSNHSFSALEYRVLTAIIEQRTLAESFATLVERGDLGPADEQEFFEFVVRLHGSNLLVLPMANADRLYERHVRREQAKRAGRLMAFLYYRLPMIDPDAFLTRTVGAVGFLFSRVAVAVWIVLLGVAVWAMQGSWSALFGELATIVDVGNLPLLYLMIIGLKAVHELGHAYACKRLGGEVPEMGVVFIATAPCAYVDASASWKFESKWSRIAVAFAGMYVELAVAAVLALVWLATPPGLLHALALNGVFLASVATLLFNLNPLMRFDGYYAFADLVEVPNLRDRSREWLASWSKRILLGLPRDVVPKSGGEALLFFGYGVGSFVYRIVLAFGIVTMIALEWPVLGGVLGIACAWALLVKPLLGTLRFLLFSDDTAPVRTRSIAVAAVLIAAVPIALGRITVQTDVVARGVLETESTAVVRATADGYLRVIHADAGLAVDAGEPLVELENRDLVLQREQLAAEIRAEQALLDAANAAVVSGGGAGRRKRHEARLGYLAAALADVEREIERLVVRAPAAGGVVESLHTAVGEGAFVRRGDELAVVRSGAPRLRVLLAEAEADRAHLLIDREVDVVWSAATDATPIRGRITKVSPAASRTDVPPQLSILAGGDVWVREMPDGRLEATAAYVQVELEPDSVPGAIMAGLTARLQFPAVETSLGTWLHRRLLAFYNTWLLS